MAPSPTATAGHSARTGGVLKPSIAEHRAAQGGRGAQDWRGASGGPAEGQLGFLNVILRYGPLIKRCPVDQTEHTQEHVSEQNNTESE